MCKTCRCRYPLQSSKLLHRGTSPHSHPEAGFQFVGFEFSREDLDMVLYGYAKGKENHPSLGLALSGLRIGELSYGKWSLFISFMKILIIMSISSNSLFYTLSVIITKSSMHVCNSCSLDVYRQNSQF